MIIIRLLYVIFHKIIKGYIEMKAFRVDWMPFGGAKISGLGLGGINHAMKEMSKEKMMVIKSSIL